MKSQGNMMSWSLQNLDGTFIQREVLTAFSIGKANRWRVVPRINVLFDGSFTKWTWMQYYQGGIANKGYGSLTNTLPENLYVGIKEKKPYTSLEP